MPRDAAQGCLHGGSTTVLDMDVGAPRDTYIKSNQMGA